MDSQNLDAAEKHYRDALAYDPTNYKAACNLGTVLKEKQLFEEAKLVY
jgi:Tfp pilus assembly protein PilF